MAIRIKSRWNSKSAEHSIEEVASVVSFTIWRLAGQGVLNLENEGFQTDTQKQRLDVVVEFIAFLGHVTDRLTHEQNTAEERQQLITGMALKLAEYYQDNCQDIVGPGDYRSELINVLNERMNDYAEFSFKGGEPGYSMRRYFGDCVTRSMGPKDSKWICDQVMEIEVPEALKSLRKAIKDQVVPTPPEEEIPDYLRAHMPDDV